MNDFDVELGGKIKARPRSPVLKLLFVNMNSRADICFRKKSLTKGSRFFKN